MPNKLADIIQVQRHFLRSINISLDFDRPDAIEGYILQPSAQKLLETVGTHLSQTQQKAFTWTGPYGTGKSLLALTLASLAGGSSNVRQIAQATLESDQTRQTLQYFGSTKPWRVLPITGKRADIETEIQHAINSSSAISSTTKVSIIKQLIKLAENDADHEGVLLVIDELGKFLEHAALTDSNIGFYQELAEAAARCKGKLVVIGVLHQAFEQYASRLGSDAQQEWAKVQGRYVDISLLANSDETLSLIGKAIQTSYPHPESELVAENIAKLTPNQHQKSFSQLLDACWPLHPLTALILGPSSRKRYGQNERSVFSFLTSAEPLGFSEITQTLAADEQSLYWPHHFWDYLKANFEPTILASTDGHRWSLTLDALQRSEATRPLLHSQIIKTIGLIELFRNGLGLLAKQALLYLSIPSTAEEIDTALSDLAQASILIFRKHTEAWAIFAGSDFDIDEAIKETKEELGLPDLTKIHQTLELNPVIARRHYAEKGAIRWFNRTILLEQDASLYLKSIKMRGNSCGEFLLVIPTKYHTQDSTNTLQLELSAQAPQGVVIGMSTGTQDLLKQLQDLYALEHMRTHRLELHADQVAMREVVARAQAIKLSLTDHVQYLFNHARWVYKGEPQEGNLTQLASEIADQIYHASPYVLSELINRNTLSSNAAKAQRELLRAMLSNSHLGNLGFESMSAAAGLYHTTIKAFGMHQQANDGAWYICKPIGTTKSATLLALWDEAENLLFKPQALTSLDKLYQCWSNDPYGIKKGLLPVFSLAFYLANRKHLAIHIDGTFTPDITEATLDEWLKDPKRVAWRFVQIESSEQEILYELATTLSSHLKKAISQDPLDSARALVSIVYGIPSWTRRTEQLAPETKKLRQVLLHASDPHKVLFIDIPALLGTTNGIQIADRIAKAAAEMVEAFGKRLKHIENNLVQALDHDADWNMLNERGKSAVGVGAEFKLEAFVTRISTYQGSLSDIEGLLMLAISKPSKDWTDHDLDAGEVQLLQWAQAFRRLEVVAHLRNKPSNRRGIGIVFGNQQTITGMFDVAEQDQPLIKDLSNKLLNQFGDQHCKKEVFLAALAEAGAKILQDLTQAGDSNG